MNENDQLRFSEDLEVLANERTYLAWIRTGLAASAAGLGTAQLLREAMPSWIVLSLAFLLLVFGAACFWLASWRYAHIHVRSVHLDIDTLSPRLATWLASALLLCAALAAGAILIDFLALIGV